MLKLVDTSGTEAPNPARKRKTFEIPDLHEMSNADARNYILAAHDAMMSTVLDNGQTVDETLRILATLEDETGRAGLINALSQAGVEIEPPYDVRAYYSIDPADLADLVAQGVERRHAFQTPIPVLRSASAIQPLAYATGPGISPVGKKLRKALLPYLDVLDVTVPLYRDEHRHLIDFERIVNKYQPIQASKANKPAHLVQIYDPETLSPGDLRAAEAKAQRAILDHALDMQGYTVRQALADARQAPDEEVRAQSDSLLRFIGIDPVPAGGECAGYLRRPTQLLRNDPVKLRPYKKILGTNFFREKVPFKLFL